MTLDQYDKGVALSGVLPMNKDYEITKANVTVQTIAKFAVKKITFADHTAVVEFNGAVDKATGETVANYTWAAGSQSNACSTNPVSAVVSGNTVTLTFSGNALEAGNTITVGAGVKSADIAANVNTTTSAITLA